MRASKISYAFSETYKYLKIHCESRSLNKNNNAWARSLVRQSDGLLIHRPGVQIPSSPLIILDNFNLIFFHSFFSVLFSLCFRRKLLYLLSPSKVFNQFTFYKVIGLLILISQTLSLEFSNLKEKNLRMRF